MPLCTHCACPVDTLYTVYNSQQNIRLAVCPRCNQFADPLIEHPSLLLFLDLVLLKPRVFLHLLFNRGSVPFLSAAPNPPEEEREAIRRGWLVDDLSLLLLLSITAEVLVRLLGLEDLDAEKVGETVGLVLREGVAQHLATLGLALAALKVRSWDSVPLKQLRAQPLEIQDGRQRYFSPILIPITLLYTALLPLLFQLFLYPWTNPVTTHVPPTSLLSTLPILGSWAPSPAITAFDKHLSLQWAQTDKIWAGTRLLGGMSAGFGLRVLLPTKPWETTGIVLAGWVAAGLVGAFGKELLQG
ncbi:hypothetical protein L202_08309 [Cryptococcus amylolentus CBS 6039]|uniref:Protein ARV n=2 Tax=Cryptococcus amylolentus TaxID=104669 RepID=A0A1E3HAU7_9TREE|nr:hypothetical protein L202_08309 [Cryptococcus amylolentus CBS 6039]ODN72886.1 hypothetical protein L202_08309 [Cryptococcus amylolentus CBS 6039]ODN98071.1 hypothetical protein I350_07713 [Cryptococcus amylolentus CBS 6273]